MCVLCQELQASILSLASKVLVGCDEVLETLQQVTNALINSTVSDREARCVFMSHVCSNRLHVCARFLHVVFVVLWLD